MPQPYKLTSNGGVLRVEDGALLGEDPGNADWLRYLGEGGAKITDPADPLPDPGPTSAEQLDALAAQSKAALAKASTLPDIKALVGGLIDGMQAIYGTQS